MTGITRCPLRHRDYIVVLIVMRIHLRLGKHIQM